MNWLDYLRGYEEGSYDRRASARNAGLLDAILRLTVTLLLIALLIAWIGCKGILRVFLRLVSWVSGIR